MNCPSFANLATLVPCLPLSLKNCDNKIVCAVVNFALRTPLATHACPVQRGFIPGRQLLSNVVDLGVYGRIRGMQPVDSDPSLISLYDFAAAFPSMSHTWIAACPTALGAPPGARDLIMSMCCLNLAHSAAGGALIPLFLSLSGVLQGCPLSGFLFAVGVDPFLWWMYKVIELAGLGKIRVCADDIGTALKNISALLVLYPIYVAIERAAGPSLKPSECLLVPTGHEFTLGLVIIFETWLQLNIPGWACFEIKSAGKYLGFWLGPKAASLQWIRTLDKYSCRTQLAADTGSAASVSVLRYNSRALPVLGYISQLLPLPPGFAKIERKMLYRVLHCPFNALAFHPWFRLGDAGGPRIRSASVLATATRLRAATTTVPHWQSLLRELRDAAEQFLPLDRALSGGRPSFDDPGPFAPVDAAWWPVCWDDKPFAWYLGEAADFFPRAADANRALHAGYDALLDAAGSGSGLQATAARLLHEGIHIGSLAGVVCTRLRSLFPALADRLSLEYSSRLLAVMKRSSSHIAMFALKTVCNGWCTSHRMHEDTVSSCVFGCSECSSLAHYLACPRLWTLIGEELGILSDCVAHRLGLHQVSDGTIRALFLAFHVYHAVKVGHRRVFLTALETSGFSPTLTVARSSIRAARAIIGHRR